MSTLHEAAETVRFRLCVVDMATIPLRLAFDVAEEWIARTPALLWDPEDLEPLPPEELGVAAHG